ncbi:TPA: YlcI/YnfO family protein [Salmonella enterica subsp. diarizonae serovar 60-67:z35:-]
MPAKPDTSKTSTKNIRFPNRMLEQIVVALENEKSKNFSAWVIDACWLKLRDSRRKKAKEPQQHDTEPKA